MTVRVERHRLDNGLRVVLSRDPSAPVVAVNLWYGVGSRNEPTGRTGFAHLFEHMMFQGSAHVPKNAHFELVERAGGSLNGSTWFDRTNYYETLPAHQLELALWLESDRMGWLLPTMTQEKLDNQRDVVKNEKRQRYDNQPYGDWSERLQALVYPKDHPYHHPVIGSMEDLDAATLHDVEEFFRIHYVPNNAVLTVCGDLDQATALDAVRRYFDAIPPGDPPPPLPGVPELEPFLGATSRDTVRGGVPLPRVLLAMRIPPFGHREFDIARLASAVLGTGRASRLYRSLVRDRRIAKDVVSYAFPMTTGAAMLLVWATGYHTVSTDELEHGLVSELERLVDVSGPEVDRALALLEASLLRSRESVGQRADDLSMFELYFDDPALINEELTRIRAVAPSSLREFAAAFFVAANRAIVTYRPDDGNPARLERAGEPGEEAG